jgi:hypothetical protein
VSQPPSLVEIDHTVAEDTAGCWKIYLEVLYGVFQRTLAKAQLTFRGCNVACRRIPESDGKHFAFWHLIQEGYPEEDRIPDLERCRRLMWIGWIIQNADSAPCIRVFRQTPRFGEKPWALWLFEHDYVVILAERSNYYLLKTAFVVNPRKQYELERDWKASQRPPKS